MTRSIIFSSLIIIVSIASVAISSVTAKSILSELAYDIEAAESISDYEKVEKKFNSHEKYLSLFLADSSLSEIRYTIKELIVFTEHGSEDEAAGAKSRLCCMIEHQRRLSGLNINSIF